MRRKDECLAVYVASSVANDYEPLQMIFEQVGKWFREDRQSVTEGEILDMLTSLIREDYVRAYRLSPEPQLVTGVPKRFTDVWFYATSKGKELANSEAEA